MSAARGGWNPSLDLQRDGDSLESLWHKQLRKHCPSYEPFWERHIVPLTFRGHDRNHKYIRPYLDSRLLDLADGSYAVFWHWAGILARSEDLLTGIRNPSPAAESGRREPTPSEQAYHFFSHTRSLTDAAANFAWAADVVLKWNRSRARFKVNRPNVHSARKFPDRDDSEVANRWREFRDDVRDYRNALVHERPLFVLSKRLPQRHAVDDLSGLAAIGRLALGRKRDKVRMVEAHKVVGPIVRRAHTLCDSLWLTVGEALDEVVDRAGYQAAQKQTDEADAKLTKARFDVVRALDI